MTERAKLILFHYIPGFKEHHLRMVFLYKRLTLFTDKTGDHVKTFKGPAVISCQSFF